MVGRGIAIAVLVLVGCTDRQQDAAVGDLFLDRRVTIDAPDHVMFGDVIIARIVDGCMSGDHEGCDTQTYDVTSATATGALNMTFLRGGNTVEVWTQTGGTGTLSISAIEVGGTYQATASKSITVGSPPPPVDAPSNTAAIDTCTNAMPITAGTYAGDTTTYLDDATPPGDCTNGFSAFGPDAFYRIELAAGQQVTATLTPSGWDASLYVLGMCALNSCTAGVDAAGSGGQETTTFTSTSGGTYHIVVDSSSQTQKGPFSLVVAIQ
jgi:hypothetical protein